ncbi:hypothetical protein EIP86_002839 [Pleurotus ostreatoroseus]|nr:hypothetical protein EIP86_002839 [Pleurotus ostreatoroseus]
MSSRITRTASVPIPVTGGGNSGFCTTNLENIISLPFAATPPRARAGHMPHASPTSPTASQRIVRSFSGSYPSAISRSPTATTNAAAPPLVFEPRIVRATDTTCVPAAVSPPMAASVPARVRRPSAARTPAQAGAPFPVRAATYPVNATAAAAASASAPAQCQAQPQAQSHHAFPRPAYLDHSALRDLLCTDAPSLLTSSPGSAPTPASSATPHPESRTGTPVSTTYVHSQLRRKHTPALDTDDESSSLLPPSTRATPAPATAASTGAGLVNLNLTLCSPTRWSEQDRHQALTVSNDGRDLTFYGPSCIGERRRPCSAFAKPNVSCNN